MSDRYKGAILSPTAPTVTPQSAGGIYTSSQQLQYQGQGVWSQAVNNPINNSLRFRNSASAYLNRTGGTSTSRRIHTFSFWTKSSVIGGTRTVISAGPDDSNREVIFIDSNKFTYQVKISNTFYDLETTQVFRDPAAWYHFVVAVDTTQATSSNRVKIYVNGSQITAFGTAVYPPQNADLFFDDSNGSVSYIGALRGYLGSFNYDGYFTEFNFIDGTALTPSSFGTTDAYGIWQPIPYTGAYGTNGFYLPFTDNSALTTSSNVGLGKDFSGNGNYWVTNNISITAGSTYDSMKDVPTNTNSNTANYPTLNPLYPPTGAVGLTWSNGNLNLATVNSGAPPTESSSVSTMYFPPTGKFYAEMTVGTILGSGSNSWPRFGVAGYGMGVGGYVNFGGSSYTTFSTGDIMSVAWDAASGQIWWGKNGTWLNSGNPAAGTGSISTFTYDQNSAYVQLTLFFSTTGSTAAVNFGQRPFAYTPPSGFYPLNTYNLPTPTILAGNQYMDATTYTGTGATLAVTNSGSMQPDFVWLKTRNQAGYGHELFDSVRGATKYLISNSTNAEATEATSLTAFNSNGFSVGSFGFINGSGDSIVGWQWRASNVAGVSNTQGTITSTVSANTTAGFSIATFTTPSSGTSSFGHGLGVTPSFVIVKGRSGGNWLCEHISTGSQYLILNGTGAAVTDSTVFNSTPTSTVVNLGTGFANANYVAYCFSAVAGYSAFGSYVGNDSADGTFIYTGFRPAFILYKKATGIDGWVIFDTKRNTYNVVDTALQPNTSGAEASSAAGSLDILSNGFKQRNANNIANSSSFTYIYACFAESPFKISRAR